MVVFSASSTYADNCVHTQPVPIEGCIFLILFLLWWFFMIYIGVKYEISSITFIAVFTLVPLFITMVVGVIIGAMT